MGGHGALICALKNPGKYNSVSAFAPISNPMMCDWGRKAFTGYLGKDESAWANWDSVALVQKYSGSPMELLVEQVDFSLIFQILFKFFFVEFFFSVFFLLQGKDDEYLEKQLLIDNLVKACQKKAGGIQLILNMREKYDHSYFFVSTFIADHIAYHAKILKGWSPKVVLQQESYGKMLSKILLRK